MLFSGQCKIYTFCIHCIIPWESTRAKTKANSLLVVLPLIVLSYFRRKNKDSKNNNESVEEVTEVTTDTEQPKEETKQSSDDNQTTISNESTTAEVRRDEAITATSENTKESSDHLRNIRETIQNILNRISPQTKNDSKVSEDETVVSDTRQSTSMRSQSGGKTSSNTTQQSSDENKTTISTEAVAQDKKKVSKTTEISTNVKKIADSVDGQLNGVGYNVNKILKVLLKKNNMSDTDVEGENNKKYSRGHKLKNLLLSPVRAVKGMVKGITTAIKDTVSGIVKGITDIGKGILKIPKMFLQTAGNAIKAIGPAITTVVKGAASLIGSGLKAAGSVITGAAEGFGKMLVGASEGFGKLLSGAAEGFGKLVGGALGGFGSLLHGLGLIGKEVAPAIGKAVSSVIGAPFKLAGAVGGLFKNIFGKNKGKSGVSSHVIVDDIMHQTGEERLFAQLQSIEVALLSTSGGETTPVMPDIPEKLSRTISSESGDDTENSTSLRLPTNLQFFASSSATKPNSKSYKDTKEKEQAELSTRVSEGSAESIKEKFDKEDDEEKENSMRCQDGLVILLRIENS